MNAFSTRQATISNLTDGHTVSTLTIAYQVNAGDPQHAVNVELDLRGETGKHHTELSLPRDDYYNLPRHINDWLRKQNLMDDELTQPFCSNNGVIHASLALEILDEIKQQLGVGA